MSRQEQRALGRALMGEASGPAQRAALWLLLSDGLWVGRYEFRQTLGRRRMVPEADRWHRLATRLPMAAMASERDKAVALVACRMAGVPDLDPRRVNRARLSILTRDDFTCRYCGGWADTVDHVLPAARGGGRSAANLVAACYPCNQAKANRSLAALGWRIRDTDPPGTRLAAALDARTRHLVAASVRHFSANVTSPLLALAA
jgi:5-methylcytosine-specific restriction endonuclease McrA